jgi:hypothetical protein
MKELNMVEYMKLDEVCHFEGRPVLAGIFAVPHKTNSDRLIVDRRAANSLEHRLRWATLPNGCQFAQLRLAPHETLRASGDDLSNYFYLLENPERWRSRCGLGRPFLGSEESEAGLAPDQQYCMVLRVWAMGDHNSVDVAQTLHEEVLRKAGCLDEESHLKYRKPLGPGPVYEGVYIDDHVVVAKVDKARAHETEGSEDQRRIEASRAAYAAAALPRSLGKAFDYQETFTVWGTTVEGAAGRVGAPLERRLQLFSLGILAASQRKITRGAMQSLLGSFIHPFGHRRELMCIFGRAFRWTHELEEEGLHTMPTHVVDELLCASLHLAVAYADIRAPISTRVHTADATPGSAGVTSCVVSRALAEGLFDHAEHEGRYTRLDWGPDHYALSPWEDRVLPPDLRSAVAAAAWRVEASFPFRATCHVNLQEARASKVVLKKRAELCQKPERIVMGTDSRVVLGAWAKGRSSSCRLNSILRSCLGWCILGRKKLCQFWLESAENPSDDPSRFTQLRMPPQRTGFGSHLLRPEPCSRGGLDGCGQLCLEVFAGKGRLSASLLGRGLETDVPLEAFPQKGTYRREHDIMNDYVFDDLVEKIEAGVYCYVHFAVPCSSWSALQNLNSGSRTVRQPEGSGTVPSEIHANCLVKRVVRLCFLLVQHGAFFSIENPKSSKLWHFQPMVALAEGHHFVTFDQCMHGLVDPRDCRDKAKVARVRKSTSLLTNMHSLRKLESRCDGRHEHIRCWGTAKIDNKWRSLAQWAGAYPEVLTRRWAKLVEEGVPPRVCGGRVGHPASSPSCCGR